jgi:hypothetical protein
VGPPVGPDGSQSPVRQLNRTLPSLSCVEQGQRADPSSIVDYQKIDDDARVSSAGSENMNG